MDDKDVKASGAGSIAIGGSVKGSRLATYLRETGVVGVPIGGDLENSLIPKYFENTLSGGGSDAPLKFPRLDEPVDMILRVAQAGSEEIRFDARAKDGLEVGPFRKRTGARPEDFAAKLAEIGRGDGAQTARRLLEMGTLIAEVIPNELKQSEDSPLVRALRQKGPAPSLLIVTDVALIPWELALFPAPRGRAGEKRFLGEITRMGRWPLDVEAPHSALDVGAFHVFSAFSDTGARTRQDLSEAAREAEFLCNEFDAMPHEASYEEVSRWFASPRSGLEIVHFACHGSADLKANEQSLILGDGSEITPADLLGFDANRKPRPFSLVFLNACQSVTGGESREQIAGFPGTLTRHGAGAIIAPLWKVDDAEAREVAQRFYQRTLTEEQNVGEVLRSLREEARGHSQTPLAFVSFGHPLLKLSRNRLETGNVRGL